MSDLSKQELLALWLEQKLTEEQRQDFERLCLQDTEFAERVNTASAMQFEADSFAPAEVPKWNREALIPKSESRPWWQWQGWTMVSMASSFAAVMLVVLNVQIQQQNGATTIRFGASGVDQQSLEVALENKVKAFELEQREIMLDYLAGMQQQQQTSNTQLTTYLLESSRKERREDFAELIKFINQQRSDDQLFYARQINQLQEGLLQEPDSDGFSDPQGLEN